MAKTRLENQAIKNCFTSKPPQQPPQTPLSSSPTPSSSSKQPLNSLNTPSTPSKLADWYCNYCNHPQSGHSIQRMKQHLTKCPNMSTSSKRDLGLLQTSTSPQLHPKRPKLTHHFDSTTKQESQHYLHLLLTWLFTNGLPLHTINQPAFTAFVNALKPSFHIPSRVTIAETHLPNYYNTERAKLDSLIENSNHISILSDGWTSITNEPIINYILQINNQTYFYKSEPTTTHSHTAEYIASGLMEVINQISSSKIISITTDNASNMVSALSKIRTIYPHIIPIGCLSHKLTLLAQDFYKESTIETIINQAKTTVNFIKQHPLFEQHIKSTANLQPKNFISFNRPSKTRWQGLMDLIKPLQHNYTSIQLAIQESILNNLYNKDPNFSLIQQLFNNNSFLENLTQLRLLFTPLLSATISLESNNPQFSTAYYWLHYLSNNIPTTTLLETNTLKSLIHKRITQSYNPLMAISYLLDPPLRSQHPILVPIPQLKESIHYIHKHYSQYTTDQLSQLLSLLSALNERSGVFEDDILFNSYSTASSFESWLQLFELPDFFINISLICRFLPPTTGAAERNWSTRGFIHSKLRNRLNPSRVDKLVFLHSSLRNNSSTRLPPVPPQILAQSALELLENTEESPQINPLSPEQHQSPSNTDSEDSESESLILLT